MALELASTYISVGLNADGLQKAIQKDFSAAGKDASKSFGRGFDPEKESRGPLGKLGKGLVNVGAVGAGAVGLIGAAVGGLALHGGIDRALNIEKAQAKLKGLGHDTESVDAIMKNALASVKGTAFGMGEAATTAAGAVAAGIKPGQDLERMLKGVANSAAAAGIDMDEMGSIWNKVATSDMAQMDVLNQVADRGIPIYQALAEEMGVTAGEVGKLASSGEVDFATFEKAMTNASGTVASEMGNTVTGKLDNTKAALSRLGESAVSQFMPMFSEGLDGATEKLDELGPSVEAASKWVADGFQKIGDIAEGVGSILFEGDFKSGLLGVEEDHPLVGFLFGVREGVQKVGDIAAGVGSILFEGDFKGGLLGIEEDHPLVDFLFSLREGAGRISDLFSQRVLPIFGSVWTLIKENVAPIFGTLADVLSRTLLPILSDIVDAFTKHILPTLVTFVGYIVENVLPVVWDFAHKIFKPAFELVGSVITGFWNNIAKPVFRVLWWTLTEVVGPAVKWLWEKIFSPVFTWIGDVVSKAWSDYLKPALSSLQDFIDKKLGPTVMWLWNDIFKPAFEGIGKAVDWAWKNFIKPAFDDIKKVIDNVVAPAIRWLNDKVFTPIFKTLGETVDKFGRGWSKMWDGIKSAAAKPVNFVIGTVWNNGLRKALNLIPGVNLAEAKLISTGGGSSRGVGRGAMAFREGGYTGRMHPDHVAGIVHGNEYVLTSEETNKLGGPRGVEAWKRAALERGYRSGGSVKPVRASHSGWKGGKYRSGKWHGGLDFPARTGTPIYAMWDGIVSLAKALNRSYGHHVKIDHGGGVQTLYAHMSRIMTSVGKQVKAGQQIGAVGSSGNSTGPHLHLEVRKGGKQVNPEPYLSGAKLPSGGVMGALEAGWEFITKAPSMFDGVRKRLGELTGPWGDIVKNAATHAVDKAWSWAKDKLNPFSSGDDGSGFKYTAGGKVERWRPLVLRALAHVGQPASLADTTLRRLNQESGGNPKAINRSDSNARMGIPSKGLMQVIDPTFRAYRDKSLPNNIWDPMANLVASMRYAKSRYGSLPRAYNKRGGYLTGGTVEATGPAWLSEDGRPELVVGPQVRNMQAGSRVYSFDETRKILHGSKGDTRVTIELVDERMRGLIRAEVRQMKREGAFA